jgi:hypothetical protein
MGTRILIISSIHLPFATALVRGFSLQSDGAYLFRVVSSFRNSGIASSLLDVRAVFLFPSNFARRACCEFFITLENYEPSSRVEPGSSRSVVRSSSTALAGPGNDVEDYDHGILCPMGLGRVFKLAIFSCNGSWDGRNAIHWNKALLKHIPLFHSNSRGQDTNLRHTDCEVDLLRITQGAAWVSPNLVICIKYNNRIGLLWPEICPNIFTVLKIPCFEYCKNAGTDFRVYIRDSNPKTGDICKKIVSKFWMFFYHSKSRLVFKKYGSNCFWTICITNSSNKKL